MQSVIGNCQKTSTLLWMQQPSISPDGNWIAFEYKGNIFKVAVTGGQAMPLTATKEYNGYPVWSPDSKSIAFASNRFGNFDIFLTSSNGGNAHRLTFDSSKDIPLEFSQDGTLIYFGTDRHDIYSSVRFPNDPIWMKLYSVPVTGGKNLLINSAGTENAHFNTTKDKLIFQDRKGIEDPFRKHHISPVTRDIWLYDLKKDLYIKLTNFEGEDREPLWGIGSEFYYLSEQKGNQNIFQSSLDNPNRSKQLTTFKKNPIRDLSRSKNGTMVFTQGGDIYTLFKGYKPQKLIIKMANNFNSSQFQDIKIKDGITEMVLSPNGKEIAYVRRGDVFVTSADGKVAKQITHTPYQERMINYAPNGKAIIYAVEKNQSWDIYQSSVLNLDEPYFYAANEIKTLPVIESDRDEFQPAYSPDGKKLAFLEERNTIKILDLKDKKATTVLPEGINFSYSDGDQSFSWSPDSQNLLVKSLEGYSYNYNVVLIRIDGSQNRVNLTQSGFGTEKPKWGLNGRMIYFLSDKDGMRNMATGSQSDVYGIFFNKGTFDEFAGNSYSDTLLNQPTKDSTNLRENLNYDINLENLEFRSARISKYSTNMADAILSRDGRKLYFLARQNEHYDLWMTNLKSHSTSLLAKLNVNNGEISYSPDDDTLFILADGRILNIDCKSGNMTIISKDTTMQIDLVMERNYIFKHIYLTMVKKFFDPRLQGVNWQSYYEYYAGFLPHINNDIDFQILLSEFIGELNSSHTGARLVNQQFDAIDETAALGLLYELTDQNKGLVVKDILIGGPFDRAISSLKKGSIIDQIDSTPLDSLTDWAFLLNKKNEKAVKIGFFDPLTNKHYEEVIKPTSPKYETSTLLYKRWVHTMEQLTDSLSGGDIGYIHIAQMNETNLRNFIDKFTGKFRDKQGVVIDTRYNPGGNIHPELIKVLTDKLGLLPRPQGHKMLNAAQQDGSVKPTCLLVSEGNYSDGFNFAFVYQKLKIGKLIGTPIAGTGTGPYREVQINGTISIGYPTMGLSWLREDSLLENHAIEPDVKVYNDFQQILIGKDQQLEVAIKTLLLDINSKK
ncbi:S41 family peptidase [Dyadobacter subterraneus]|uniref:Tricorn protease homolog n=1 Tax=Dyadobacter subterraneus TaxID=2773304 RepID=A0ABR9WAN5_9BACT|nr:S41 family peptidase [Dyadobacter subterraneus]MBE9461299.1 PD40 domain-containing protein [Dyadobacter subterraneus]